MCARGADSLTLRCDRLRSNLGPLLRLAPSTHRLHLWACLCCCGGLGACVLKRSYSCLPAPGTFTESPTPVAHCAENNRPTDRLSKLGVRKVRDRPTDPMTDPQARQSAGSTNRPLGSQEIAHGVRSL